MTDDNDNGLTCRKVAAICKEDCSLIKVIVFTLLLALPTINTIVIVLLHEPVINLLSWILELFADNFWIGLGMVQAISMVTVPLNFPYTLTAIFLAYCLVV